MGHGKHLLIPSFIKGCSSVINRGQREREREMNSGGGTEPTECYSSKKFNESIELRSGLLLSQTQRVTKPLTKLTL